MALAPPGQVVGHQLAGPEKHLRNNGENAFIGVGEHVHHLVQHVTVERRWAGTWPHAGQKQPGGARAWLQFRH